MEHDILLSAREILAAAVSDDYVNGILERFGRAIVEDVLECSGIADGDGYTDSDVRYAIGRAILGDA